MGHAQTTTDVQIKPLTQTSWAHIERMNMVRMNKSQNSEYRQRFTERAVQQFGADSDFLKRKLEHEALTLRLHRRDNP